MAADRRPRQQPRKQRSGTAGVGYSGTPLAKKLGIRDGQVVAVVDAPGHYRDLLTPVPAGVRFVSRPAADAAVTHVFVTRRRVLARAVSNIRQRMADDATLWVSWPKRSAGVETDVTEDAVREVALPLGLVDVKVCAIDQVWSGLKLVVRRELRRVAPRR
jgi:hypothetical protein